MERADSPASVRSATSLRSARSQEKPLYRLFPSVEPTPPASPVSVQRASSAKAAERRRSSSLDDSERGKPRQYGSRHSALLARRARKPSASEVKPMSTVQEQQADSPTVPTRFTFKSYATGISEDGLLHGRSNSAPDENVRDSELYPLDPTSPVDLSEDLKTKPPPPPACVGRQAAAPSETLHGLGLTLPPMPNDQWPATVRRSGSKPRPNLRVEIIQDVEDKPPPPPPKSPRHYQHSSNPSSHSRNSSVQSRHSVRSSSPKLAQPVTYNQVKPILLTQSASVRRPPRQSDNPWPIVPSRANSSVSNPRDMSGTVRGRTRKPIQPKLVSTQATNPALENPVADVPPLFSKSRAEPSKPETPRLEQDIEGERTPKVITPKPEQHALAPSPAVPAIQIRTCEVSPDEMLDLPPPTPLKDQFILKSRPKEGASGKRPRTPLKDDPVPKAPAVMPTKPKRYYSKDNQDVWAQTNEPSSRSPLPPPTPPMAVSAMTETAASGKTPSPQLSSSNVTPNATPNLSSADFQSAQVAQPKPAPTLLKPEGTAAGSQLTTPEPLEWPLSSNGASIIEQVAQERALATPSEYVQTLSGPNEAATGLEALIAELPSVPGRMSHVDPLELLKELTQQSEALHVRYASLRADRQKLSKIIVSSLKEQKAGLKYASILLDQHLSLAAINSSMDTCFAKLKALDCRKEEAIGKVLTQHSAANIRFHKLRKPASAKSAESLRSKEFRRSRAEIGAEIRVRKRASWALSSSQSRVRSKSRSRKAQTDNDVDTPAVPDQPANEGKEEPLMEEPEKQPETDQESGMAEQAEKSEEKDIQMAPENNKQDAPEEPKDRESEKRDTVIKSSPAELSTVELEERTPESAITDGEDEQKPKKTRIKGAKAAQILGLTAQANDNRPGSPGITLPNGMGIARASSDPLKLSPAIEIHISTSPTMMKYAPPPSPEPQKPLPTPPVLVRKEAAKSVANASSAAAIRGSDKPERPAPKDRVDTTIRTSGASAISSTEPQPTRPARKDPANPRPTQSARKDTGESARSSGAATSSVHSDPPSRAGSSVESTPEEPEVLTPAEEEQEGKAEEAPAVFGSQQEEKKEENSAAAAPQPQPIQVLVDDDHKEILDYYPRRPSGPGPRPSMRPFPQRARSPPPPPPSPPPPLFSGIIRPLRLKRGASTLPPQQEGQQET